MILPTQDFLKIETKPVAARRFSAPMSDLNLQETSLKTFPKKTKNSNKRYFGVRVAWTSERNLCKETFADGGAPIPSDTNCLQINFKIGWHTL